MSWTQTSQGSPVNPQHVVWSEDITTYASRAVFGSVMDFIPPGKDWQVIVNTAATNLSNSGHVELFVSNDGTNFYRYNTAGFNATTGAIDTATPKLIYDVSSEGQYAYYKLKFTDGGGAVNVQAMVGGITDMVL